MSAAAGMVERGSLSRAQKAAAILVALGKPTAGRLLKFFKQDELKTLIEGARQLKTIPQSELEKIVAEFEEEFAAGAGLLDSAATMDTLLTENLSADEVDALMGKNSGVVASVSLPPPWPAIEAMEPAEAGEFLSKEHPQTIAFIMSNLSPSAAAKALLALSKPLRVDVAKRMLSLGITAPAARKMIENQLRAQLMGAAANKNSKDGQVRVVGLLNEMDKADLDALLGDLREAGAADVDAIRSQLFSFEDIVLLSQKARVTLFDGIATELVTNALRGAPADVVEAILSSIGARSRRMIESELGSGAEIPAAEIQRSRRSIASTAIAMSRSGAFDLPSAQAA